jgi:hypothetical protein
VRTFAGIGDISSLSTSDFAGDGTRRQSFRHEEAPEEEGEFRTFAPVADEVEPYSQCRESGLYIPIPKQTNLPISYNIAPSQKILAILFNPEKH